jgi:ribosomal protein L28
MAKHCEICGKTPVMGRVVSHAHNVRARRFEPNLQRVRALINGGIRRLRVCTRCIRSTSRQGGLRLTRPLQPASETHRFDVTQPLARLGRGHDPPVPPRSALQSGHQTGNLLFVSDRSPTDHGRSGSPAVDQTDRAQERRGRADRPVLLAHVVKTTVYLLDMADFATMNDVYSRHFVAPYPARSTVAVAALPRQARVEIDVTAAL